MIVLKFIKARKNYNQGVNKVSYAITFISNGKILSRKCVNIKTNLGDAPIIGPPHRITTHHIQNTDIFKIPYFRKMPSLLLTMKYLLPIIKKLKVITQ